MTSWDQYHNKGEGEEGHSITWLKQYPLLEALLHRRSRRFGKGMYLEGGPLTYQSQKSPQPLSIEEEAALAFAGCGVTGPLLAELPYQPGKRPESGGGNIMANFIGRTVASGDALHCVALFVINDQGAWLLKRPQDFDRSQIPDLVSMAHQHQLQQHYESSRIPIADTRLSIPAEIPFTAGFNKWSTHQPGTTCFLPVAELSALYINILLTSFEKEHGYFIIDNLNNFRPAGIRKFARSKGGHLYDDPAKGRLAPVNFIETLLQEFAAIEMGAIFQNLGLMA